jgi:hypothetical protein
MFPAYRLGHAHRYAGRDRPYSQAVYLVGFVAIAFWLLQR